MSADSASSRLSSNRSRSQRVTPNASPTNGSAKWRPQVEISEFGKEFRILCRGMQEFVDEDLVTAYFRVLGSLTQSEFGWLVATILTDTTLTKLPAAPVLLQRVNAARAEHRENVTIAGLLDRTPESVERDRAAARENARQGLELIKAAYAAAMAATPAPVITKAPTTIPEPVPDPEREARRAERLRVLQEQAEALKKPVVIVDP
jgi:hypothetical protein